MEAIKWGRGMGGWWLGWIHTHPNHLPVLSAQDVCATNTLGMHLSLILLEGRAPIAMVQSWVSTFQTQARGVELRKFQVLGSGKNIRANFFVPPPPPPPGVPPKKKLYAGTRNFFLPPPPSRETTAQRNRANIIAAELRTRTYGHYHRQQQGEGLFIPHTTTTTQGHGEVGWIQEWWITDVGSDRTTGEPETGGHGHQCRHKSVRTRTLRLI